MSASRDASSSSLRTSGTSTTDSVPRQRARHRADGQTAVALPTRPPVIRPPLVAPRVTVTACSCGTAWTPGADRCGFCGLTRPVRLPGIRRLTGRHWLAGPGRRLERLATDRRKNLGADDAWLAAISGTVPDETPIGDVS